MSNTETLRRAAARMRERAEAATPGPWERSTYGSESAVLAQGDIWIARCGDADIEAVCADAAHIASWHPAVALQAASALDAVAVIATWGDQIGMGPVDDAVKAALNLARTYLGEQS